MKEYYIDTKELKSYCKDLKVGDKVYLSGTVYTARDAAHKRLCELLDAEKPLPLPLEGSVIYYMGPSPALPGMPQCLRG